MWGVTGKHCCDGEVFENSHVRKIYFKKLSESKTVNSKIPSMFCVINRVCGCVRVPENVGVPGTGLMMYGASVGAGVPAAEVVVKL